MKRLTITATILFAAVEAALINLKTANEAAVVAHKEFQDCFKAHMEHPTEESKIARNLAYLLSEEADAEFAVAREEFSKAREASRIFKFRQKQSLTQSGHAIRL